MKKRLVCLFLALMAVFSIAVPACAENGGESVAPQETVTYEAAKPAAPKISKVENAETGIKITWGKVSGASKYRLYYKKDGGDWKKITDTTKTGYTWTKAKSGTKYTFAVRTVNSKGKLSAYSAGKSITYVAAPKISKAENAETGIKITWGKVSGASKYRLYYKKDGGDWKKITDTTKTSYTWTKAKSGTQYAFSVRAINSAGKLVSTYGTSKSIVRLTAPEISKLENAETGVKISWGKVTGATYYRVYYKKAGGDWTKITDTKKTNYTWTKAKSNTVYSFTVRALSSSKKSLSAMDANGRSILYIPAGTKPTAYSSEFGTLYAGKGFTFEHSYNTEGLPGYGARVSKDGIIIGGARAGADAYAVSGVRFPQTEEEYSQRGGVQSMLPEALRGKAFSRDKYNNLYLTWTEDGCQIYQVAKIRRNTYGQVVACSAVRLIVPEEMFITDQMLQWLSMIELAEKADGEPRAFATTAGVFYAGDGYSVDYDGAATNAPGTTVAEISNGAVVFHAEHLTAATYEASGVPFPKTVEEFSQRAGLQSSLPESVQGKAWSYDKFGNYFIVYERDGYTVYHTIRVIKNSSGEICATGHIMLRAENRAQITDSMLLWLSMADMGYVMQ